MQGIWNELIGGGIVMIPLLLTSIIGLAVVIERALFLRRKRILKPDMLRRIERIEKAEDVENLLKDFEDRDSPFLNIIRTSWAYREGTKEELKEAVVDQGRQEARVLERGLVILETAAGIAPLLGLLGTVLGMIKVFRVISVQGLGQTQSLSGGISEALITTVVGLTIAIPMLVAYNYFNHRVEDLVLEIEQHSARIMEKIKHFKIGKGRA
jgi:biopolymer transport protein ExbB